MKKFISFLFAITIATSAHADNIAIVNTGSDSGGFKAVLSMIFKADNDTNSSFIQAGNPVVASSYFDRGNIITMWSTEWPGNPDIPSVPLNEDTIIALQVYETILCSRKYSSMDDMKGETIKIATWGDTPAVAKFIDNLSSKLNSSITIVPYDGSGATTRGYLGGDADTIFTIQTKQSKVEADGTCFAFSANGDLDFAFVDVILSVNAKANVVSDYRSIVSKLSTSKEWLSSFYGTETYVVNSNNAESIVSKTLAAVDLNS